MADLDHARKYLEPSRFEQSPLARVSWHAWPAAILVVLIALVCQHEIMTPQGTGQELMINAIQNVFDAPKVALMVALFAAFHVLSNLGFFLFDRSRSWGWRLLDVLSILPSLVVFVGCLVVLSLFSAHPTPITP